MTRREVREELFKLVYEGAMRTENAEELLKIESAERDLKDPYIESSFKGIFEHAAELDEMISKEAHGWKLERLTKISLAIMRVSVYEMIYNQIPVNISINEAVELAKKYGDDKSPAFINGVLNTVARNQGLKKDEK